MAQAGEHYVFHGGTDGRQRLAVLARVMRPTTVELFERLGVAAGWHCLDVGCGGGDVTQELARLAHPAMVVGTDIDEPQLLIARQEAGAAEIENVDYRLADAAGIADAVSGEFDLVYARFLLTHLPAPEAAVVALSARARVGGIVAVEDIDVDGYFWHPPSAALDRYLDWYARAHRARGGDPTVGRRLPALLHDAGLTEIGMRVVQPIGTTGDIKQIAPLTLAASAEAIRVNGIASDAEIGRLHAELQAFSADPTTLVSMPRVVQAWGLRADRR